MEKEDPFEEFEDFEGLEEEKTRPLWKKILWRIVQVLVALLVTAGLLYLSGIREYFFYQKTPGKVKIEQMKSVLNEEQIKIPVFARIVRTNTQEGSTRSKENIQRLIEQTNNIWAQADIRLNLGKTKKITLEKSQVEKFFDSPLSYSKKVKDFNENAINVFFVGNLKGPSGLAYMGTGNILIADYTTSEDFLVFAHEVGHVLGLKHTGGKLMDTEAENPNLSVSQIKKARTQALEIKKD